MVPFRPLEDVRVLDLSQFVPGPYGTCLLGDLGAEVIKIEHPGGGDALRSLDLDGDAEDPLNHYFRMLNRNKQSLTLDLKSDRGQDVFHRLAETADVVVESFRPGTTERLGVDYETLRAHTADLVYCSVTGYGQSGPYSDLPGHDINFQAVAGVAGITNPGGKPSVPALPFADLAGGAYTCIAVLAALLQDDGQYVDVSMTDVMTTWTLPYAAQEFADAGLEPGEQNRHQKYPSYGFYETSDGKYLALAAVEPRFWRNLCEWLDLPDLVEHHHATDPARREAVEDALSDAFAAKTRAEWLDAVEGRDVPVSPVTSLQELATSPNVRERQLLVSEAGYGTQFRFPARFSDEVAELSGQPPTLGEDTDAILERLGFDPSDVEALRADGVV